MQVDCYIHDDDGHDDDDDDDDDDDVCPLLTSLVDPLFRAPCHARCMPWIQTR